MKRRELFRRAGAAVAGAAVVKPGDARAATEPHQDPVSSIVVPPYERVHRPMPELWDDEYKRIHGHTWCRSSDVNLAELVSFDLDHRKIHIRPEGGMSGRAVYSAAVEKFDEVRLMAWQMPIRAITPEIFTLEDGWSLERPERFVAAYTDSGGCDFAVVNLVGELPDDVRARYRLDTGPALDFRWSGLSRIHVPYNHLSVIEIWTDTPASFRWRVQLEQGWNTIPICWRESDAIEAQRRISAAMEGKL